MAVANRRAEVVARDRGVAEQLRAYLRDMLYAVEVKSAVEPTDRFDVDVVVYHVSPDAAREERRHRARPGASRQPGAPRYWLDAVRTISERAPSVPILVAVPAGEGAADRALDSGATDVIAGELTPKVFRRRLELLEAFQAAPGSTAPDVLTVPLAHLRSPRSGRLDARLVAEHLRIPLKRLAEAMGVSYPGLHKTPDAPRVQEWLRAAVRALELADQAFGDDDRVRAWLNRPLPELDDETPLEVILAGEATAVETLLANARAGIPG